MEFNDIETRKIIGSYLKDEFLANYNIILNDHREKGLAEELSYEDMYLLAQIMKEEMPSKYNISSFPSDISFALDKAVGILDPNNISEKRHNINLFFMIIFMLGFGCIASGMYELLFGTEHGIFMKAYYFFFDEKKEFPLRIIPGLALLVISLYGFNYRETPAERTIKCRNMVIMAIEHWIKTGP